MSVFEIAVILGVAMIALALGAVAITLEKWTRHLANIADRLLDIDKTLNDRR